MSVTASPNVASTVGIKNVVLAPLTVDNETTLTYGTLQALAGAIDVNIAPQNTDPDVQYFDDIEGSVLNPDPEVKITMEMADIPLSIQADIFGHTIDTNGVLVRKAGDTIPYYALGFESEKSNGKGRKVWLTKGRAKPMTETYHTKEGKTVTRQSGKVEWTFIKRTKDGEYQYIADEDENSLSATNYASFLETVYQPTYSVAP